MAQEDDDAEGLFGDLRVRVIEMVRAGASRREAAEVFSLAGSTAVKWLQRWEKSGSAEAKPRGGSVSPLEVHAMVILEVVRAQPDATFVELLVVLKKQGIHTRACSGVSESGDSQRFMDARIF